MAKKIEEKNEVLAPKMARVISSRDGKIVFEGVVINKHEVILIDEKKATDLVSMFPKFVQIVG